MITLLAFSEDGRTYYYDQNGYTRRWHPSWGAEYALEGDVKNALNHQNFLPPLSNETYRSLDDLQFRMRTEQQYYMRWLNRRD